jgi:hypothetical protein
MQELVLVQIASSLDQSEICSSLFDRSPHLVDRRLNLELHPGDRVEVTPGSDPDDGSICARGGNRICNVRWTIDVSDLVLLAKRLWDLV